MVVDTIVDTETGGEHINSVQSSLWMTSPNHEITEVVCYRGDWVCTLCRSDQDPVETYECENAQSCGGVKAPYTLSNKDQRVSCLVSVSHCCGLSQSASSLPYVWRGGVLSLYCQRNFACFPLQRCEKLALLLYCHPLSAPFHEPVSPLVSTTHECLQSASCD